MTMSPFFPCGKPCSAGTHNETVKSLALSPVFDRSNQDRMNAVAHGKENAIKTTLSRYLIKKLCKSLKKELHFTS